MIINALSLHLHTLSKIQEKQFPRKDQKANQVGVKVDMMKVAEVQEGGSPAVYAGVMIRGWRGKERGKIKSDKL